jgi:protocatechuate 3,4-dioxygenase beta subunit
MIPLKILLPALVLQAVGAQRTPIEEASIAGVVVHAGTNSPIAGATVELTGIAPRLVEGSSTATPGRISVSVSEAESDGRVVSYIATTGRDGKFEIRNVRPGANYQLVATSFPEYLPAQYGQRIPAVPGRSISLASGEQLKDVRVEMTPGSTISGQVVDSNGRPMGNVVVELRRPWYLEGWRLLREWRELIGRVQGVGRTNRAGTVRTNARGEFSFTGIAPAQYYLRTDGLNEASLSPVDVHAGANMTGIRVVVPELRPRTVRGQVVDESGGPVTTGQVVLLHRGAVPLYQGARLATAPVRNGTFVIVISRAGIYDLVAQASGNRRGRREIEVRDADLTNVRVQVKGTFAISGAVAFENRGSGFGPETEAFLTLYPLLAELPAPGPVRLSPNGSFSIRNIAAGDYRIEISPILTVPPSSLVPSAIESAYVRSIRLDGRDVLNDGVHLETATNAPLQVVISMNGGTFAGRVLDAGGMPVANAHAVLVPNAPRRRRGDLYKTALTDDSGRFQLRGLAPGDYKLFAWERVEDGAWQDPQFLNLFEDRGAAVRMEDGAQVTRDVRLIPAWN